LDFDRPGTGGKMAPYVPLIFVLGLALIVLAGNLPGSW
jgi:hypothetical protein